jgi:hypothetical protein
MLPSWVKEDFVEVILRFCLLSYNFYLLAFVGTAIPTDYDTCVGAKD